MQFDLHRRIRMKPKSVNRCLKLGIPCGKKCISKRITHCDFVRFRRLIGRWTFNSLDVALQIRHWQGTKVSRDVYV